MLFGNLKELKRSIYIIYIIFFLSGLDILSNQTQLDTSNNKFRIEFVKSINSTLDLKDNKGFLKVISEFILGDDEFNLVRPNGIIAYDTSDMFIIDQWWNSPIKVNFSNADFFSMEYEDQKFFFPSLACICKAEDKVFFTDSKLNKLYYFNEEDLIIKIFAKNLEFNQPTGIAYSKKNMEFAISETANHRILILNDSGILKNIIGKRGIEDGEFNYPTYLWFDNFGNLYVNDAMNFRIQIFSETGDLIRVFGKQGDATGYFASSKGIATDSYKHIYVVDAIYNTVQIFDEFGNFLYNFGSKGKNSGEFVMPAGIYIDNKDFIYVADTYNSRIQIFKLVKG